LLLLLCYGALCKLLFPPFVGDWPLQR
jgi:hypothetical protein